MKNIKSLKVAINAGKQVLLPASCQLVVLKESHLTSASFCDEVKKLIISLGIANDHRRIYFFG